MSLDVHAMVQQGAMANDGCILCGTCADVCPSKVIHYAVGRGGRGESRGNAPQV
jgi:ferredoxin